MERLPMRGGENRPASVRKGTRRRPRRHHGSGRPLTDAVAKSIERPASSEAPCAPRDAEELKFRNTMRNNMLCQPLRGAPPRSRADRLGILATGHVSSEDA